MTEISIAYLQDELSDLKKKVAELSKRPQLIESQPRKEPKFSELYAEYRRFIDSKSYDAGTAIKDLARIIGNTEQSIRRVLSIGNMLSELEVEMIDNGELRRTHAYEIAMFRESLLRQEPKK